MYGRVIIPEAVVRELQAQRTPEVVRQWTTSLPQWLQVRAHRRTSGSELDPDEREAIALAETLRADALINDDEIAHGSGASEVMCDWNSAGLGRRGGGRLG